MKNFSKKQLVAFLVILASFSALSVKAETLAICDHNNDGVRNLTDVALFASCAETFDADNDNDHDLADLALYTSNNQSDTWCETNLTECNIRLVPVRESEVLIVETEGEGFLPVCDHNGDGFRNLTDVALFSSCAETFDADRDGDHDLSDISAYSENNQDATFCAQIIGCGAKSLLGSDNGSSNAPDASNIKVDVSCDQSVISWETSKDSLTLLSYGETDSYSNGYKNDSYGSKHSFVFANLNPGTTYHYMVSTEGLDAKKQADYDRTFKTLSADQCGLVLGEKIEQPAELVLEGEVLGQKESSCKIDEDVAGQTQWADGSLIRACDMKVYIIEDQKKHYIKTMEELLKYIGQRIYNVADSVVNLF